MLNSWSFLCLILVCIFKVCYLEKINRSEDIRKRDETTDKQDKIVEKLEDITQRQEEKCPIWNIAHMVNSISQIDYYLNEGANSLEFDIEFDSDGRAVKTHHGSPCDCMRKCSHEEAIDNYLKHLRNLTTAGSIDYREELVLLFFDCKLNGLSPEARVSAGADLATRILDHYFRRGDVEPEAYILISVPSITQMDFVESFRNKLKAEKFIRYYSKIGYDFSANEDIDKIQAACRQASLYRHIWIGDGITNCLDRTVERLEKCLRKRNITPFIEKVYYWTVDKMSSMRYGLWYAVDGIITNEPRKLVNVLNEEDFAERYRLATRHDNPWEKCPLNVY